MGKKYIRIRRKVRRFFDRHYKGLSDLLGVVLFLLGTVLTSMGVIFALCAEHYSVAFLYLGFCLIYVACDLFEYGRE